MISNDFISVASKWLCNCLLSSHFIASCFDFLPQLFKHRLGFVPMWYAFFLKIYFCVRVFFKSIGNVSGLKSIRVIDLRDPMCRCGICNALMTLSCRRYSGDLSSVYCWFDGRFNDCCDVFEQKIWFGLLRFFE